MTKILGVSFGTKNGNNDSICKEALKGAQESGCEVEFIRAQDLDIKHCTGCIACVKALMSGRGNMCIHKDDFDWLAYKMFTSDGIIMVDPIFETGASGLFSHSPPLHDASSSMSNAVICDLPQFVRASPTPSPASSVPLRCLP